MSGDSERNYNCILVKKNGSLKQLRRVAADEMTQPNYVTLSETSETYASVFRLQATWCVKKHGCVVELWGRTTGRAGQENAYDFPPPVDEALFFGNCLLVLAGSDSLPAASFTPDVWKQVYATLFGGFHNLDKIKEADKSEYDELADVSDKYKTKEGYLKDGFIVEDGADTKKPGSRKRMGLTAPSSTKTPKTKISVDDAIASAAYILSLKTPAPSTPVHEVELEEEAYEADP
jgi:hypothetical protein